MKPEYEIRFYPINYDEIKARLLALSEKNNEPDCILMHRVIFDVDSTQRKWLRIRKEGEKTTITLKQIIDPASSAGAFEHEITLENDNFTAVIELFHHLSYKLLSYQENKRTTFYVDDCIITIDEWPGLEPLLEIESDNNESLSKMAQKLALSHPFPGDIPEIYKHVYGISLHEFNAMKELTFDNYSKVLPARPNLF
jgi:adenylate cyclase class 2